MAWGAIIGGLLGAGGQIAGGALSAQGGKVRQSDIVSSYYNPALDYALQAANYDALNQIGWGDLNNVPTPIEQLMGRIENVPLDAKTRRRAFTALSAARDNPALLSDPYGLNLTPEERDSLIKTGTVPGRTLPDGIQKYVDEKGRAAYLDQIGAPIKGIGRLQQALGAAGMNLSDLQKTFQEQKDFEAKIARLKAAGLPQLAEQMIIDRAKTGATATGLAAAGADFASTGTSQNPLFQALQAQDQRNMDRFATRAGLQANFGGISQAAAQKQISDAELDQNLRVLQNALTTSGLLQATLTPGTQAAQGQSSGQLNAAQIAAQQAMAANQLRLQGNINSADSFGNAIGSATSTLGSSLANAAMMGSLNSRSDLGMYNSGYGGYGPGSTANQNATFPNSSYSALFGK